ncbi:Hypothetical protein D9617_26g079180 [Elsinoe fawcettii]|nr:Hypothetical protein D9617_26g079180 [Elsinoe fawcettii]
MVGCASCYLVDLVRDGEEARNRIQDLEKDIQAIQALLRQQDMADVDRRRHSKKLHQLQAQLTDWNERQVGIRTLEFKVYAECQGFCQRNSPDMLAEAFTTAPHFRAHELEQIWQRGQSGNSEVRFLPESLQEGDYKGLDLFRLPSTPDSLVNDPVGFQLLLQAARLRKLFPPTKGIGPQSGPTMMNYGAALGMFGMLYSSSVDKEDQPVNDDEALETGMKSCNLSKGTPATQASKQEPRTEHEFQLEYNDEYSSEAGLFEGQRWALLGAPAHMANTALLTGQYRKIMMENEDRLAEQRGKKKGDVAPTVPGSDPLGGWPSGEALDWSDFTNWLNECETLDPQFRTETVPAWTKQRAEFSAMLGSRIKKWVTPENILSVGVREMDPRRFLPAVSIADLDSKRLGFTGGKVSKAAALEQQPQAQSKQSPSTQGQV